MMMSNMSYCRFHNTLLAFKDCFNEMEDVRCFADMDLSDDENRAMLHLANYARKFLERFEELQQEEEYEFARNMEPAND